MGLYYIREGGGARYNEPPGSARQVVPPMQIIQLITISKNKTKKNSYQGKFCCYLGMLCDTVVHVW